MWKLPVSRPDTDPAARRLRAPGGWAPLVRALLGWLVLCAGIGLGISISRFLGEAFAPSSAFVPLLQAVLVASIVVPTILVLRCRIDRRSLASLGLSPRIGGPVILGTAVGLLGGAATWLPALGMGWIVVERIDPATLVLFLVVNSIVLFLYEALPEELALRGYAWTNIRDGWSPGVATVIVTVLFCLSSLVISLAHTGSGLLLGVETSGPSLAPSGSDPIAYVIQLAVFGLALCAARRIPLPGVLGVVIAFHVTQLTVTRALLGGLGWIESGVTVRFTDPDVIALVLVHIALCGAMFILIRKVIARRLERRA